MELLPEEIKLISEEDFVLGKRHYIGDEEIKPITISTLIENSSYMLALNEYIQKQLNLSVVEERNVVLMNRSMRKIKCFSTNRNSFQKQKRHYFSRSSS